MALYYLNIKRVHPHVVMLDHLEKTCKEKRSYLCYNIRKDQYYVKGFLL